MSSHRSGAALLRFPVASGRPPGWPGPRQTGAGAVRLATGVGGRALPPRPAQAAVAGAGGGAAAAGAADCAPRVRGAHSAVAPPEPAGARGRAASTGERPRRAGDGAGGWEAAPPAGRLLLARLMPSGRLPARVALRHGAVQRGEAAPECPPPQAAERQAAAAGVELGKAEAQCADLRRRSALLQSQVDKAAARQLAAEREAMTAREAARCSADQASVVSGRSSSARARVRCAGGRHAAPVP